MSEISSYRGDEIFWQLIEQRAIHGGTLELDEPPRLCGTVLSDEDLKRLAAAFRVDPTVVPSGIGRIFKFEFPEGLNIANIRAEVGDVVRRLYKAKGIIWTD